MRFTYIWGRSIHFNEQRLMPEAGFTFLLNEYIRDSLALQCLVMIRLHRKFETELDERPEGNMHLINSA